MEYDCQWSVVPRWRYVLVFSLLEGGGGGGVLINGCGDELLLFGNSDRKGFAQVSPTIIIFV